MHAQHRILSDCYKKYLSNYRHDHNIIPIYCVHTKYNMHVYIQHLGQLYILIILYHYCSHRLLSLIQDLLLAS